MTTTVEYIDDAGIALGNAVFTDISEILIPDFKVEKHDVYMRYCFKSKPDTTVWKVIDLVINGTKITIHLLGVSAPESLGNFAQNQFSKKPSTILRSNQYQLVEVEFGFQQHIFSSELKGKNKNSSIALMPGELHKKRPCIVIHCEDEKAQIIPLTTRPSPGHPKQLPISRESFNGLSSRYKKNDSSALISMVQTVSVYRIFPMRNKDGNYSNDYIKHKLCKIDKSALIDILSKTYAKAIISEASALALRLESMTNEKKKLLQNLESLKESIKTKDAENEQYKTSIRSAAQYLDLEGSFDDLMLEISKLN